MKKDKKSGDSAPGPIPSLVESESGIVENSVDMRDEDTHRASAIDDTIPNPSQIDEAPLKSVAPRPRQTRFPVIAGYRIDEIVGRGGMGVVYRAYDLKLGRTVAIKTLLLANHSSDARKRIENEAQLLAKVQHPGVVQIFEFGFADDPESKEPIPFIAMEFVDGDNLDKFNHGNPLKPRQAASLVYELAKTLTACHKQGIIHRDLKPANVLMASDVEPKLTDFGLARICDSDSRMTRSGEVMGTPGFMAPEQASGAVKNLGPSVDVYGLGALLYELLTGRPPFMAPDPMQTMIQVLTQPPLPPGSLQPKMPRDLDTITLKCLEKKARHRYESCEELAGDLRAFLSNKPISAKRTPALRKAQMWMRRHPAISSLIGLAIAATFAAILGTAFHVNSLQTELNRSQRIINEGRALSKWLLDDFRGIIEGTGGVTYARSQLAERTQTYLDALLKEAADDEVLKTDLAYAFNRLASLQEEIVAKGTDQTDLASLNNAQAEKLLGSLKNINTELAQKVLAAVSMQRVGGLIAESRFEEARDLLSQVENQLGDSSPIKPIDRLNLRGAIEFERFQIAIARGDKAAAEASLKRIAEVRDALIADGTRVDIEIIAIVNHAFASELFLEPDRRLDEILDVLNTAQAELNKVSKEHPLVDMDRYLCTIETKLGNTRYYLSDFEGALSHYQSALDRNLRIYQRDKLNSNAQFNLALAWQLIGETQMVTGDFDQANDAFNAAEPFFTAWNDQLGGQLDQQDGWLMFLGCRAELYRQTGEHTLARQTINRQIDGMISLGGSDVVLRRKIADALLASAFIQMQALGAGEFAEKKTLVDSLKESRAAFEKAKSHFDLMDKEGFGNESTRNQAGSAAEMIELIDGEIARINEVQDF